MSMVATKRQRGTLRRQALRPLLVAGLLLTFSSAAMAESLRTQLQALLTVGDLGPDVHLQAVNIFGDGDPRNGDEDSRMNIAPGERQAPGTWDLGGGTIHCDGRNRGSAMVVDTREHGGSPPGVIVLTSAHVLYDLDSGRRFDDCRFRYMGLAELPGYRGRVDFQRSRFGPFDPDGIRTLPEFGRHDWALLHVTGLRDEAIAGGRIRLRPYALIPAQVRATASFQFVAYSRSRGAMTISTGCRVVESGALDLGGGAWRGQLLDDCDSEAGASGGGLVVSVGGERFLVGVRSGSHWDGEAYPGDRFPGGPPAGSRWDVNRNTNFGRAVDTEMVTELRDMLHRFSAGWMKF